MNELIAMPARKAGANDEISVSCLVNEIPAYVEPELDRIYEHHFSSLPFLRLYCDAGHDVNTYVVRRDGVAFVILLFRVNGGIAHVLNTMIRIEHAEVLRFARYVFEHFDTVWAINFRAVQSDVDNLPFPFQRHNSQERFPVALPATPQEYTARLGRSTREAIKRYRKKLLQDFPSFSCRFYVNEEIDEHDVNALIDLSAARIALKKKRFGIDAADRKRIMHLARMRGFVCIIRINGCICAGTINFRVGNAYFLEVITNDQAYNDYRLGTICCYMTLCECIARGGTKYDFGGGWNHYKVKFLGVQQDMDCVEIYRSRMHLVQKSHRAAKTFVDGYVRQMKLWLLAHEKSLATRFMHQVNMLVQSVVKRG
ncbi:GNAT family N-acetyltransferase [Noviherbaspirillum sp.]|uniref:GNAT family N-acetyltransferase n=1 Tax=Noviherbaspirillum sp. TaxID=1926288 RepID=UPI002D3DC9C6|nr:GNAT family N-acetyltransferase [Noviherbaspirillum sp.]HZW20303.1 GNAT family N-acetyltransferase [Noviherbaspirillum sp.]